MAAQVAGVFDEQLRQNILKSKILVVGAGGIGCEILKNLVLCGFPNIDIIDLDTIDVSNLNRQFLFHKEHVGKSKAEIARQSALSFNPNVSIKAYHDSITTPKYGVTFFKKFSLVLNALDNRQARNHVNRMCLSADVTLIESGTAGYNGQVELIKKGLTQCYECTPKEGDKSYPQCTIRNTPSEPIHCIVWAKHLFNQLFGEIIIDEDVSPDATDPENLDIIIDGNTERTGTRQWAEMIQYDPIKLFNKFFSYDIRYLLSMSKLWRNRRPPQPIEWENINNLDDKNQTKDDSTNVLNDQKIWSLSECCKVFTNSLNALKLQRSKLPKYDHLVWDKDDKNAMDFVAACANIRSTIFGIEKKSRFEIKSMAGRIIPAIATTNAITAGIVVMHAFNAIQEEFEKCKSVYMRLRLNARNQIFVPDKMLNAPNSDCFVCSSKQAMLKVDTDKMTVKEFNDILIKEFNMISPDVITSDGNIIISSEEGETDENLSKKLKEIRITDGVILDADDFIQEYKIRLVILHKDAKRDEPFFEIIRGKYENKDEKDKNGEVEIEIDKEEFENQPKKRKIDTTDHVTEDEKMEVTNTTPSPNKRKSDPGEGPSTSKRVKSTNNNVCITIGDGDGDEDDDLIIVED